jgi:hypothetical protein
MRTGLFFKLFFILALFIAKALCEEKEILAFKILPKRVREEEESFEIRIQPNRNVTFQGGFSLCMRVNFLTWETSPLIYISNKFSLTMMRYKQGQMFFYGLHVFPLDLPIDPAYWNSICITFNAGNLYFNLSINGLDYVSTTKDKKINVEQLFRSAIELVRTPFTGHIADFNIWSRPLSPYEVYQYSLGCDVNFVENSKPDLTFWSTAALIYIGNNTKKTKVPFQQFCNKNENDNVFYIRLPYDRHYEEHSEICKRHNGELFFPRNDSHLQNLISYMDQTTFDKRCKNVWVPFKRSRYNHTKWVYDSTNLPEKELLFEQWKKAKPKPLVGDCMFFNITSIEYVESDCENELITCSFCQIEKSRQIFTLKHNCWDLDLDGRYYIMQDKVGNVIYYGILGITNIQLNEESWWMIDNIRMSQDSRFNEIVTSFDKSPTGLQSWDSPFSCNDLSNDENSEIQIKIQNVNTTDPIFTLSPLKKFAK